MNEPASAVALGLDAGVDIELVLIPAGRFMRGQDVGAAGNVSRYYESAAWIMGATALAATLFLLHRAWRWLRRNDPLQFSTRGLLVFTAIVALCLGCWTMSRSARTQHEKDAILAPMYSESPAHEEVIAAPFYLAKYEITQEQYAAVIGGNPSQESSSRGNDFPVNSVTWFDAAAFCREASLLTGRTIRLPTESEWEYACRAGTRTAFCFGDDEAHLDRVGWYDANSGGHTHAVGGKEPNAFGLYDMHGNVAEWTLEPLRMYGWELIQPHLRALRGGHASEAAAWCASYRRDPAELGDAYHRWGFRVVVEVE